MPYGMPEFFFHAGDNNMRVICIGSAVIDISAGKIPDPAKWFEKQKIETIRMLPGGDAVNQSITLAKLGMQAELVTSVGEDDNGLLLKSALEARGVDTRWIIRMEDKPTGTALVLVSPEGERNIFSTEGAYEYLGEKEMPPLDGVSAVTVGSLYQMPGLEHQGLAKYLHSARGKGIPVFADLGSDKRSQKLTGISHLLPEIDYFLPSLKDALWITGTKTPEAAAAAFISCGAKNVVIKCGAEGAYYCSEIEEGWVPAAPVKPVDTTGAGDCMVACFLAGILQGRSLEDACRVACRIASFNTLYQGAAEAPITPDMLKNFSYLTNL